MSASFTRPFPKEIDEKQETLAYSPVELENIEKARQLLKRFQEAKKKREQYVPIWQEVANYVLPYRGGFYDVAPNSGAITTFDRNAEIYDDTAPNALIKAASALYSYTANPATQWFNFELVQLPAKKKSNITLTELQNNTEVRSYLQTLGRITCMHLNEHLSSPYHGFCQELLAFSTSAFLILEDFTDKFINIQPVSARDLYVLNDVHGGVGEVYRTVILTNEQAIAQFGNGVGQEIIKDAQENPLKERVFIHIVKPRPAYDESKKDVLNMPIASYWVDYQSKRLVHESGYEEFPYAVGRLNVPAGYVYGFSPAMNVRHTIKSLNKLIKQQLSAGDLALNPAMNVPIDTYINPLSMKPAALNYHEMDAARVAEPMHTIGNFQINLETIKDSREQVRQGMLIDLINQTDRDNTYQAMQEQLLQLKLMSPWQGNLERDALKPMIIRVFNILNRRGGIFPEPPAQLAEALKAGYGFTISYQSPLAKAQRHFDVSATERTLAFGAQLAEVGGMDIINVQRAIRLYSDLLGAPPEILYSESEMKKKEQEQARQMQQQQQLEQQMAMLQAVQSGAGAARDMAQADQAMAQTNQIQGGAPMEGIGAEGMM